jgi:glycosyltransferase involved in cell wall biosynthesis
VDRPGSLLVFADDWGRHPSSCQHLVRCLLDRYPVQWVNTIGTRTPRLNWETVKRGAEKLRHWFHRSSNGHAGPANLQVINPKMWPWLRSWVDRRLNRFLLSRQLAKRLRDLPAPVVAVTTLPVVADLVGVLPVDRWVYYCVDDFSQWPGLDQGPLGRLEEKLVQAADILVAAGEILQQRLEQMGRPSFLLTHGVDLEFWKTPKSEAVPEPLKPLEPPWIVFWGVVDRRMDSDCIDRLTADLDRGTVVLVGPQQQPDQRITGNKRVRAIGPVDYDRLPCFARHASVLVMPYADLPVTKAMQPLKLKEYLATGKPVVARNLPATRPWADCLDLAESAEGFSRLVRWRLARGLPESQAKARERLATESWSAKASQFENWIIQFEPQINTDEHG